MRNDIILTTPDSDIVHFAIGLIRVHKYPSQYLDSLLQELKKEGDEYEIKRYTKALEWVKNFIVIQN